MTVHIHSTFTASVPMAMMCCPHCGTPFGVVQHLIDSVEPDVPVRCPNGHAVYIGNDDDTNRPSPRERRLMQELMEVRHELEQAEARAIDAETRRDRRSKSTVEAGEKGGEA